MKKKLFKGLALLTMSIVLLACNKTDEVNVQSEVNITEGVLSSEVLKRIEVSNKAQHQLVLQSIEELKEEGELVTIEQINGRIEENGVTFKSSGIYQEFENTTSVEILQKYASLLSERLVRLGDAVSDDTLPEEVLSLYDKEKDLFIKEILKNTSLSKTEKRDIIVYLSISTARLITQLSVYDDVQILLTGQIETKFFKKAWRWVKKQWTRIVETCAFGIVGTAVGGVSYYTGVGAVVGAGLLKAGLPRLGYCFNRRR